MRIVVGTALAIGIVALLPTAAGGASGGGWVSPPTVLAPRGAGVVDVAVTSGGGAVVVWGAGDSVQESTRVAGRGWGPPSSFGSALTPVGWRLAVDRAGDVFVVGTQYDQSLSQAAPLRVLAYERANGTNVWNGPVVLSGPVSEYDESDPDLAGNDAGEAVVAWTGIERYGDLPVARAALLRADGTWEAAQNLGYAGPTYSSPSAAIDAQGDALVVWARGPIAYAESRLAGSAWGEAVVLSQHAYGGYAGVAMNRRGDALAVWLERDDTGHVAPVSSFRPAGVSGWMPTTRTPINNLNSADFVSFVLDDAGNATLVAPGLNGEIVATTRAVGAVSWAEPVALGDDGYGSGQHPLCLSPHSAVDATGGVVVVWGGAALHAARRLAGSSTWEKTVIVAPSGGCGSLALAGDSAGDAVAVWHGGGGSPNASVLDSTPPVLTKLVIPRTARSRHRVRFAVTASDLWSSVASPPLWRFGDGTSRRGTVVNHLFRRPGRYRVSVTATDQAGNTAVSTATIRVTPA